MSTQPAPGRAPLTWDSLALPEKARTWLQRLARVWAQREKFRAYGLEIPRCVLLVGPQAQLPEIARLLSQELAFPLIIPELRDMIPEPAAEPQQDANESAQKKLAELFARARALAPSILFFDGIERFGPGRATPLTWPGCQGAITQFLVEIDVNRDVLLLAATSDPGRLDGFLSCHLNHHVEIPLKGPATPDAPSLSKVP